MWKFPKLKINKLQHWFVEGADKEDDILSLQTLIHLFKDKVTRCEGLLSLHFWLTKLNSEALLSYLNTCISGELLPFQVPPDGSFLDVALSRHNVVGGYLPKVGDKHIMILSLASYVNEETRPALLEGLGTYPMIYRWSNRFVFLSEHTAGKEIKRYTRDWNNKIKGFTGILKEAFTGNAAQKINHDACAMKEQTVEADAMNQSQTTRFGYYTSNVILMHEDVNVLRESAQALRRYLEQTGFGIIEENVNAMDAWIGSIPGHGSRNIRRLFFNAIHWAHCLPLHTTWSGNAKADPSSLLGPQSPPVFYASTREKTPFRFWPDIQDVGHMLVLGPTGTGKSTFLQLYMAQFLRYSGARVFIFDKDNSHKGLTYALGGEHYHIHPDTALTFCPMADLSTQGRALRAEKWIEDLVHLQGVELTSARRKVIHQTIQSFQEEQYRHGEATAHLRNLSVLRNQIQDTVLRDALSYYTLGGSMPLMDASEDGLRKASHINTFELDWLLNEGPQTYTPVISYLTDHIDALIEASSHQPTLIVIEEMSFILKNPLLADKIINWTKVLRKFNGRIVFATQALTDLYDAATKTLNAVTASIVNSCPIKIFLPNPTMEEQDRSLYYQMGFSERECAMLASDAVPKKHYFVRTSEGKRLIDLYAPKNTILTPVVCLQNLQ